MTRVFHGKTLDECLNMAANELSLPKDKIQYLINKETKGIFKKYCEITVQNDKKNDDEISLSDLKGLTINANEDYNEQSEIYEEVLDDEDDKSGKVLISEGTIKLLTEENQKFKISFENSVNLLINGQLAKVGQEVTSKDVINFNTEVSNGKRELNIQSNSMEAKISITYTNAAVNKVYTNISGDILYIKSRMVKGDSPPHYDGKEIKQALLEKNIVYGINEAAIEEATLKNNVKDLLVASGLAPINDENDKIEIYFQGTKRIVDEDSKDTIDYRNLYSISNVVSGSVIAELIIGKDGVDGINIFGNTVPRKLKKSLHLKAANGCKIEDNKVIATIDGQPTVKSGVFYVNQVFQAPADVDIKSGNIKFIGDVKIAKNIKEGMCVEAGNSVDVGGNVETATIISQGDTSIRGSIINSKLLIGSNDMVNQQYIDCLEYVIKEIKMLISYFNEIKRKYPNINKKDGEIIKIVIENKLQTLPEKAAELIKYEGEAETFNINKFVKEKILGFGPLSIKNINELQGFISTLKKELQIVKENLIVPVNVYINYIQDSEVTATGNIYITGKGQYVSNLSCLGDIIFTQNSSVSRGGVLKAKGKIKAGIVGSPAGVSTILKVPTDGIITANIAYNNTTFCFGERQYTLDIASKQVKAYMDKKGEIVVEKFVL